jgi:two-component system, OmpR family, phosphate regulon sensor histidine kinase PhoR
MDNSIRALDHSFKYFESLFNNTVENCILMADEKGSVISINDAFEKTFGYNQMEVEKKNISIFFTDEDIKKRKPEIEIQNVLTKGQSSDNNFLVKKDKSITWVYGESILVTNEKGDRRILKVIQDINTQKKSEEQITRLDKLNEKILKSIEDAVIVLDEDLNILNANASFNSIFKAGLKGESPPNFVEVIKPYNVSGDLVKSIRDIFISEKGVSHLSIEIESASREKIFFDVSCNLMEYESNTLKLLVIMRDITANQELEKEREDVIGFVAHELRNPLANLVLCNELLGDLIKENDRGAIDDILQRSKNNVMRLNKLIGELYDAAKVSSGNLKLNIDTFNFDEMIIEAIDTVRVLHPSYNIIVTGKGSIEATGDRYRLIQVVTNYLSNGIKYSNGNTDVQLHISYNDDSITVSVKDNGLGISSKQLPFIFDRFFRAEKTKNLEGIGLGLFLCRQIILAHRGKVWAESEEGKGSTFYFSIPRI